MRVKKRFRTFCIHGHDMQDPYQVRSRRKYMTCGCLRIDPEIERLRLLVKQLQSKTSSFFLGKPVDRLSDTYYWD